MLGKDLIKFIQKNKMQSRGVAVLISDGVRVNAQSIEGVEISDSDADDCTFVKVMTRPWLPFDKKCAKCWVYLHPECYPSPLSCWVSTVCKELRHVIPTKKDKKFKKEK
jgi:hypothetical protein